MLNIPNFNNHLPVKIRFGEGRALELDTILKEISATHVLVMVDEGIGKFNPAAQHVLDKLTSLTGISTEIFEKPAGEPTIAMVNDATAAVKAANPQAIVALGGGSVIDTAKAARLCAQLKMSFKEYLAARPTVPEPTVALIALPTSAGTGSEVSGGSVIADPEQGTKNGIAGPLLRAQYAVVDPELTYSMPPSMTANTGIDALAQAIAGMVAHCRTPIGDAIAMEAISMMAWALPAAYKDGSNKEARSAMACGSMMAGLTMNISDCTAEHALGQAIGGLKHVPHGLTIGLVVAEVLDRERHVVPEVLERVADALGAPASTAKDGTRAVAAMKKILADLDFPVLSSLGFEDRDLDELADLALADYFITMAPKPWSKDDVITAFSSALSLSSR